MRELGICPDTGAIYEGCTSTVGYRRTPAPVLLPARFSGAGPLAPVSNVGGFSAEVFVEESFDPVARIRRGRIYSNRGSSLTSEWRVHDPLRSDLPVEPWAWGQAQRVRLRTYQCDPLMLLREPAARRSAVWLGWEEHCTPWQILAVESPIGAGPLLTLRARFALGDIPSLDPARVPVAILPQLQEALSAIDGAATRLGPVDVVDRCRAALSIVFGEQVGNRALDLGNAIARHEQQHSAKRALRHAASLVNLLHPRGKPNEQFAKDLRPPGSSDAQLAVQCVALVLHDLGWAADSWKY